MPQANLLLLSAYDADSHRYWHQQLTTSLSHHNWTVLSLKDRFFSWRMGGNALSFQAQYGHKLHDTYDLVLATSMTDLSSLRGLYPHLAAAPNLLYFHENQFAYPTNQQQQGLLEIQLRSILSARAADQLIFNSAYNRHTFLTGAAHLLGQMPDGVPAELVAQLKLKSTVLPVPIKDDCKPVEKKPPSPHLQVVWNHRWEHDKGPETLLALLRLCQHHEAPNHRIRFHILGRKFRTIPPAMQAILESHQDQCLTLGYVNDRAKYIQILQQSDVVISTAWHDFQGIAMQEAVACGCKPIAPKRLAYPDLYPAANLYKSTTNTVDSEATALFNLLGKELASPVCSTWLGSSVIPRYDQLINSHLSDG